ncbi:MAG: recombination mediator RecR [Myxococcota bacterium]
MTVGTANPDPIQRLILELGRLPGIGERSAARLAFYLVRGSRRGGSSLAADLAQALLSVTKDVCLCDRCQNFSATPTCRICNDGRREKTSLCVVEGVADLRALEESGAFHGRYFVLHGALAPLEGIGPEELKVDALLRRVGNADEGIEEVILATNADVEGDATALYIAGLLRHSPIKVTRLASGVPMGGELEYLDQATLGRALADRREFSLG